VLILGLDTATEAVGAAVWDSAAGRVLGRGSFQGPASHGEQLAPVVAAALAAAGAQPADLGLIGVGRGPGPFTGLRVGLVHAQVMGWALGIPVHGICTLDVLAEQARRDGLAEPFLVVTDARRREVYWAAYDDQAARTEGPHVGPAGQIPRRAIPAVGIGAADHVQDLPEHRPPLHPDPAVLAELAGRSMASGAPAEVAPLYLRRPDATASTQRKRVTPR
jgi:tRNA threonylcarbamoyl adenosine modification protein YeaZ